MGWQEEPDNLREPSNSEEADPSFPVFLTPFAAVWRENWTSIQALPRACRCCEETASHCPWGEGLSPPEHWAGRPSGVPGLAQIHSVNGQWLAAQAAGLLPPLTSLWSMDLSLRAEGE